MMHFPHVIRRRGVASYRSPESEDHRDYIHQHVFRSFTALQGNDLQEIEHFYDKKYTQGGVTTINLPKSKR